MYSEFSRHERERRALLVPCGCQGNRLVGHLADYPPTSDTGLVELVDHCCSVHLVSAGGRVDRRAVLIEADECIDVVRR